MNTLKNAIKPFLTGVLLLAFSTYSTVIGEDMDNFTLNLDSADITQLIQMVAEATGKNFVVDPRVSGRVTVISATPVDADKLYEMFLSILQVHGFSVVPSGSLIKVVPDFSAKQSSVPVVDSDRVTRDQLVSQVIPISHVPVDPLVAILRPMVPQEGLLASNPASNSLLVTDRLANIQRLKEIIRQIDLPHSDEVEVVKLHYASAADVVRTLSPLQHNSLTAGSPSNGQLVADERMNNVLIAGSKAIRERMRSLITALDSPLESGGNTKVIFLKFAKAEDIAAIVSSTGLGADGPIVNQNEATAVRAVNDLDNDGPNSEVDNIAPHNSTDFSSSVATISGASDVSIRIDARTNALIITANPSNMTTILNIIERLDVRPSQVMVEAVIAEVSEDNIRELGINFLLHDSGNGGPVGLSNLNGVTGRLANSLNTADAGLPTVLENGLSLALGNISGEDVNFGLLLNAIASNAKNNILSTPTIVTLDNKEAEIIVGTNVPFITGQRLSDDNSNPFQTIERRDVGLRLKVKPQINEGDTITLELEQEVSNVNATAIAGAADITTSTRSITTTVLVDDGQTLILGGLKGDIITDEVEKVPLLGDIPMVGRLFQHKSRAKSKNTLVILLRPVILRDGESSGRITNKDLDIFSDQSNAPQLDSQKAARSNLPALNLVYRERSDKPMTAGSPWTSTVRVAPAFDTDQLLGEELQWVEMPDGSSVLKIP